MTTFKRDLKIYDSDMYDAIFIERLSSDTYGNRLIQAELSRSDNQLEISITDEGQGFGVENLNTHIAEHNLEKPQGRGIYLAKLYTDQIRYNKKAIKLHYIFIRIRSSGYENHQTFT
ncbi:MAG: ATP-binding protein [Desulfobacteraceae bacterium]|nr:ATP-binding protein [Desulfobacteraceae bacterium]